MRARRCRSQRRRRRSIRVLVSPGRREALAQAARRAPRGWNPLSLLPSVRLDLEPCRPEQRGEDPRQAGCPARRSSEASLVPLASHEMARGHRSAFGRPHCACGHAPPLKPPRCPDAVSLDPLREQRTFIWPPRRSHESHGHPRRLTSNTPRHRQSGCRTDVAVRGNGARLRRRLLHVQVRFVDASADAQKHGTVRRQVTPAGSQGARCIGRTQDQPPP